MQSGYHNTAILNGMDQLPGVKYAARDVFFEDDGRVMHLSLDMKAAYPDAARVRSYIRNIRFDRQAGVIAVTDEGDFEELIKPTVMPIMCGVRPEVKGGKAIIGGLILSFDEDELICAVEERPLEDARLEAVWGGKNVWRLTLTRREMKKRDSVTIEYRKTEMV